MANPTPNHDDYLRRLRTMMQEAVRETQRLDAKWNRLNEEINSYLNTQGVTDIVQRDRVKSQSLPLQDAFGGGKWWREKAVYLATVIQAEIAMREAGL